MQRVTKLVCGKKEFAWPEYVVELVEKIKEYNSMLEDYRQAKVLNKLSRGEQIKQWSVVSYGAIWTPKIT